MGGGRIGWSGNESAIAFAQTTALIQYGWPGNVRELENAIERAIAVTDGPRIDLEALPIEDAWKRQLNSLLRRNQVRIDAILREAGVPVLDDMGTGLKPEG